MRPWQLERATAGRRGRHKPKPPLRHDREAGEQRRTAQRSTSWEPACGDIEDTSTSQGVEKDERE